MLFGVTKLSHGNCACISFCAQYSRFSCGYKQAKDIEVYDRTFISNEYPPCNTLCGLLFCLMASQADIHCFKFGFLSLRFSKSVCHFFVKISKNFIVKKTS